MKIFKYITLVAGLAFFTACSEDSEDFEEKTVTTPETTDELQVEKFIYRGMNDIYLYKKDVPVLADSYFSSEAEKEVYLEGFSSPEQLFKRLKSSSDKFSYINEDYEDLYKNSSGALSTTGMAYGLVTYCQSCTEVFGYVRYVLPNTSAEDKGVERGMIFNRVDGQQLTTSNMNSLLNSSSFSIGLASIEDNVIRNLDQSIDLTKQNYIKNPVLDTRILEVNGSKVGYLLYDSFTADFDEELNNAFAQFESEGIEDLVLDLRYNGGGSVRTATDLAAMITGQFPDEVFMKEEWNEKYQTYYEQREPHRLLNHFNKELATGTAINSLKLNRVFVLTTRSSASASELIINGLDPYIDVVHIGEVTTGKFQASIALYDSPNFSRDHASLNSSHSYSIQPLVLKSKNVKDVTDYVNGINPDILIREDVTKLLPLGDPEEPLLKVALDVIQGNRVSIPNVKAYEKVGENTMFDPNYQRMYIDRAPAILKD